MARFDTATGRYVYLTIDSIEYRVFFEETGAGIPLVLQHTAGADGRQWRHLLEDKELQRDFRMIAYDLPYHGKSVPPTGIEWWRSEYRLTKDFLMKFVLTLSHELALERPVYMGSSIGGHLATDLALHHADKFRAIIGVEAAISTPGGYDDQWSHPRVSNEYKASVMYGLMSPTSPEKYRRETAWIYSQGAPPVFKGDLYYYSVDHDLSNTAEQIDTSQTPLYLLTGEYDWASTPEMSEDLAKRIKGAKYQTMRGLGHFPMSEDPARFKEYIAPVLREIRSRAR
ncbi:MAG: alpha/beta hydrolase [Candidatus Binatus sp.]|uniref:alpha/beta fold hydrolase n=1 Tax=Candidatus Binatus sp. TaxID=2811406 RepID=UPI00272696A6|nr:alpha/beta hydrolase [Candidatus Binatus sp.]MDO8434099.1 alpha/beta hydrolase [Candidatus Binatus sp.]